MSAFFDDRDVWDIAHGLVRCYGDAAPMEARRRIARMGSPEEALKKSWRSVLRATIWISDRANRAPIPDRKPARQSSPTGRSLAA